MELKTTKNACDFCEDPEQYGVTRYHHLESGRKEYYICVECRKRNIERLGKKLNEIFEHVPGKIDETRKAAEFDLSTGRSRPRFFGVDAEELR